jgi:hypothetical protein
VGQIASIVIKGAVVGTEAEGDRFGFVAGRIAKLILAGERANVADDLALTGSGDVRVRLVG